MNFYRIFWQFVLTTLIHYILEIILKSKQNLEKLAQLGYTGYRCFLNVKI
jgi:hypothetical protein